MKAKADNGELLTTGTAARLAGVDPQTLRIWERDGHLQGTRTANGFRLFTKEAVLEAMAARAERRSGNRG